MRKLLKKCYVCKIVQGKTLKPVEAPTLPWYRVSCNHAFENVGLDFAGPLYYMKSNTDKESRKCYILLFTYCFSRSIHLELTSDISSKTYLLALKRFISIRGYSKIKVSNNLKSFKPFVASKGITWNFILERPPWWGGFYERLAEIVKNSLKKVLLKNQFNYIELTMILQVSEFVIN